MDRGLGRCLWLDRSCDEGQAHWSRAATLTATKDVCLTLLFCGRFLQAGKPPGPAAGACMPGAAVRQIRGELDWLCLKNRVVGWESWQCCELRREEKYLRRQEVEIYGSHTVCMRLCHCDRLWVQDLCPCMPSGEAIALKDLCMVMGTENAWAFWADSELVSNASMSGRAVGPQLAREELKSAGVCMQIPAGILWVWSRFWVRNLRAHTTDLISWTAAYRLHVLPWVRLTYCVEGPWIFVVCAASCLQHPVLVCRQPVSAFLFNQVEHDKSVPW